MVRAKGLEPPRALAHQDLNLARLPFPPRPRNRLHRKLFDGWRRVGGSPGTRTQNLLIKSQVLCQIELATRSECSNVRTHMVTDDFDPSHHAIPVVSAPENPHPTDSGHYAILAMASSAWLDVRLGELRVG